jgi:4-alpha-glucanotransferase
MKNPDTIIFVVDKDNPFEQFWTASSKKDFMNKRASGILLHITSLPSQHGIGDLGPEAYRFVDFLDRAGQRYWQVLPLNPTNPGAGNSPYNSPSAYAGNSLMISPELLAKEGLLSESDLSNAPNLQKNQVNYEAVIAYKDELFRIAFQHFMNNGSNLEGSFLEFCTHHSRWLDDYALFKSLKNYFHQKIWIDWEEEIRSRHPEALQLFQKKLKEQIEYEKFLQFVFFRQWSDLKKYCEHHSVEIIGDVPYYVSLDSVDVWKNHAIFKLDENRRPTHVAGVPPDYFSETGQLWGNPVYRWDLLKEQGFDWWIERIEHNLAMCHWIRIDHFRGFIGYWEVSATQKTAINGTWVKAPAEDFLNSLLRKNPRLPIIAEDLGVITDDVKEIIQKFNLPGMKILLFAFDDSLPRNPYAPHNHIQNCLIYTGTHDNNTIRGWFDEEASKETKARLFHYLGRKVKKEEIHWEFIRMALSSVADLAIIPVQDVLGLKSDAKMNRPGTANGNWKWRLQPDQITEALIQKLRAMTEIYGRV